MVSMHEAVRHPQASEAPTLFLMVGLPAPGRPRGRENWRLSAERCSSRLTSGRFPSSVAKNVTKSPAARGGCWRADSSHWPSTSCACGSASFLTSDCGRAMSAPRCVGWPLLSARHPRSCTCRWIANSSGAGFSTVGKTRRNRRSQWLRQSSSPGERCSRSPTGRALRLRSAPAAGRGCELV